MPRRNRSSPENNVDLNLTYEKTLGTMGGIRAEASLEADLGDVLGLRANRLNGSFDAGDRTASINAGLGSRATRSDASVEGTIKLGEDGRIEAIGGGVSGRILGFGGGLSGDSQGNAAISGEAFGGKIEVSRDKNGNFAVQVCYGLGPFEACTTFSRDQGDPQNEGSLKLGGGIKPSTGSGRPNTPNLPSRQPIRRPPARSRTQPERPPRPKAEKPVKPHEDKKPNRPPKKPTPKPKADIRKKPEPTKKPAKPKADAKRTPSKSTPNLKKKPQINLQKPKADTRKKPEPINLKKKPQINLQKPKADIRKKPEPINLKKKPQINLQKPKADIRKKPPKPPLKPKEPSPKPQPINLKKPAPVPAPKPPKTPRPSPSPKTPRPPRPVPPTPSATCKDGKWVALSNQHRGPWDTAGPKPVAISLEIDKAYRIRVADRFYGTGLPDANGQTWLDRERQQADADFGSPSAAGGWTSAPKDFETFETWGDFAWNPNSNPAWFEWGPDDPIHRGVCRVRWTWKRDYYDYKLDGWWKPPGNETRWASSTPWHGSPYQIAYQIVSTKPLPPCRGEKLKPPDDGTESPDKPVSKPAKPRTESPKPNPPNRLPNEPTKIKRMNCCKKIEEIYKYLGIAKLKKNKFPVAKAFLSPGGTGDEDCEDYYQLNQALFRMLANGLILNPKSSPHGNPWQSVNATAWAGNVYEMVAEAMSNGDSSQKFEMAMAMQVTQLLQIIAEQTRKIEFLSECLGIEPDLDDEEIPACFTVYEGHKGFDPNKKPEKIDIAKAKTDTQVEETLAKMLQPSKVPIVKWVFNPDSRSIVRILRDE